MHVNPQFACLHFYIPNLVVILLSPSQKVIAKLISDTQMERYSDLTVQNFVDSSTGIRWCPFPDCGYAICMRKDQQGPQSSDEEVKSKEENESSSEGATALNGVFKMTAGVNVECGQGHGFCWECMGLPHEPCCCELWEKWKDTVMNNMSGKGVSLPSAIFCGQVLWTLSWLAWVGVCVVKGGYSWGMLASLDFVTVLMF